MQRRQHPAWRLLAADSASLVASFLHWVFVVPNVRVMAQFNLAEALEDTLYGFKDKPLRIRFRLLDPRVALGPNLCEQDIAVTQAAFERLDLPVRRVFTTENEVNFLAFPPQVQSLLMNRATLMAHLGQWGEETQPSVRNLPHLHDATLSGGVRLEQERIGFSWIQQALAALPLLSTRATE